MTSIISLMMMNGITPRYMVAVLTERFATLVEQMSTGPGAPV